MTSEASSGPSKTCAKCKETKPVSSFYAHRTTSRRDGLQSYCKKCSNVSSYDSHKARNTKVRWNFGLEPEEYEALLKEQNNVCAICLRPETVAWRGKIKRLAVDHDERTGRVRGLLCTHCNTLLGKAQDNPETLLRAIEYLRNPPVPERYVPEKAMLRMARHKERKRKS